MKPFTFNLEVLLRLRQQRTEEALALYAQAVQARTEAEVRRLQGELEHDQFIKALSSSRSGRVSGSEQQAYLLRRIYLQDNVTQLDQALHKARATEEQRRQEYLQRHRDVDVLERLRTRRADEYRRAAFKHEELLLADLRRPASQSLLG